MGSPTMKWTRVAPLSVSSMVVAASRGFGESGIEFYNKWNNILKWNTIQKTEEPTEKWVKDRDTR